VFKYGHYPVSRTGGVTMISGVGMPDVHVVAYLQGNEEGDQLADVYTNAQGNWTLWLNPGTYTVGFYKSGYNLGFQNLTWS